MRKATAHGIGVAVVAASLMITPALLGPPVIATAQAACEPGDRIDSTTAEQAKRRAESAGFAQVRMERKGCDNVWHGTAMKGGTPVHVAVSPSGQVNQEGD